MVQGLAAEQPCPDAQPQQPEPAAPVQEQATVCSPHVGCRIIKWQYPMIYAAGVAGLTPQGCRPGAE